MTRRWKVAILAVVALLGTSVVAVQAQEVAPSRGSFKVRARFFNPFVPGRSQQLSGNPFGLFAFAQAGPLSIGTASAAAATATAQSAAIESVGVSAVRPDFDSGNRSDFVLPPSGPLGP